METLRAWGRAALDFAYPPHCAVCAGEIAADEALCTQCWAAVAEQAGSEAGGWGVERAPVFADRVVWGAFGGALQEAIHAVKFNNQPRLGRALGWRMGRALADRLARLDYLLPVPLHPARMRERGYNQSEEIARGLGTALGVPVRTDWVRRCKNTRQQALLPAVERRANLRDAFTRINAPPTGACIGLVDDVWTTGATLSACAEALSANRLWAIVVARPEIAEK